MSRSRLSESEAATTTRSHGRRCRCLCNGERSAERNRVPVTSPYDSTTTPTLPATCHTTPPSCDVALLIEWCSAVPRSLPVCIPVPHVGLRMNYVMRITNSGRSNNNPGLLVDSVSWNASTCRERTVLKITNLKRFLSVGRLI